MQNTPLRAHARFEFSNVPNVRIIALCAGFATCAVDTTYSDCTDFATCTADTTSSDYATCIVDTAYSDLVSCTLKHTSGETIHSTQIVAQLLYKQIQWAPIVFSIHQSRVPALFISSSTLPFIILVRKPANVSVFCPRDEAISR